MGQMEERRKERAKKLNIKLAIMLGILAGATLATSAILGPVAIAGFAVLGTPEGKKLGQSRIKRSFNSLIDLGYIRFGNNNGKKFLELTPEGKIYIRKKRVGGYKIDKSKKWDGKWRIVMFDIKEARRTDRDQLRAELEAIGFYRFQNRAWFYPYDCEDLITVIKSDYHLGRSTVYVIAEEVENDKLLRQHFGLIL